MAKIRLLSFFRKNNVYEESKKDPLFNIAKSKVNDLTLRINGKYEKHQLNLNTWCKIIPESDFSPWVLQEENNHVIYFPENSEPYTHEAIGFDKFCCIKSGVILEKISGKTYKKGERFTVPANTPVCPVSVGGEAFAVVTYG